MNRTPPISVRRLLAEEVGFGCPVEGCGSPYLTWHHFDPAWAVKEHHDPAGMVALCRDHHPEADRGAFTTEQLRTFKKIGRDRSKSLGARFNWMREELLAVVGGNFYYETPIPIRVEDTPVVWFNRDDSGRVLVNLHMLTTSNEPRLVMQDNFWITEGSTEREITCPPSGNMVSTKYPNGDQLKVEFREHDSLEDFDRRYSQPRLPADAKKRLATAGAHYDPPTSHAETIESFGISFPLTTVEITMDIAGTGLSFGPQRTSINTNTIMGSWIKGGGVGMQIGEPSSGP
jgi:hypothetical protein